MTTEAALCIGVSSYWGYFVRISALSGWLVIGELLDAPALNLGLIECAHDQKSLGRLDLDPPVIDLPAARVDLIRNIAEFEIYHAVLIRESLPLARRLLLHSFEPLPLLTKSVYANTLP